VLQLTVNFFWSILFFRLQAFGGALIWLIVLRALILWMIFSFRKVSPLAAKLQIPYLLWVTFAGYLNAGVWLLNGG
jgi:tryptophan-rich sensory protein